MRSIGIGEIQKNTAIFNNLSETLQIVDKRRKKVLALVYPIERDSVVDRLAGKYRDRIEASDLSWEEIKEAAMRDAMRQKYGLSS